MAVCHVIVGAAPSPAWAAAAPASGAPQLRIGEIFTGTQAAPTAQYVVLRLHGQGTQSPNNTLGYGLVALDASGSKAPLGILWMDQNVSNVGAGAPVLIATPDAVAFFGVTPDFVWYAPHMPSQGALCVLRPGGGYDDCVLFGAKQANSLTQLDPNVINAPINAYGGIPQGALVQRIGVSADSAQDFWVRHAPWPQNNAGDVGRAPVSACGNGVVEGLEACDAGAACGAAGGSCSSVCTLLPAGAGAVCGNGLIEPGESCDDFNTVDLDGCSSSCQWEFAALAVQPSCGNGRLELGEACDGGTQNGQGQVPCTTLCQPVTGLLALPAICGNGAVESPFVWPYAATLAEQCDAGAQNGQPHSGCSSACRFVATDRPSAVCGNGTVEPGEECDDGQTIDGDGCASNCRLETHLVYACGNGVLEPQEACDDGALNGTPGDRCTAVCSVAFGPQAVALTPQTPPASAGSASSVVITGPASAAVRGGSCQAAGPAPWVMSAWVVLQRSAWRRRRCAR